MIQYLFLALFIALPTLAQATDRFVSDYDDNYDEGTLRVVLQVACDEPGNDRIQFFDDSGSTNIIRLKSLPLTIPLDCDGTITLVGSSNKDTIIDATSLPDTGHEPAETCIINIYTDGNTLENLSIVNNEAGAGICLFGRNNTLTNNRIGTKEDGSTAPNRYGIIVSDIFQNTYDDMDGSGNTLSGNEITFNLDSGILIEADAATVSANMITTNGGDGIYIGAGSTDILIGGTNFETNHNTIADNKMGGVIVAGDKKTKDIQITHNSISQNDGMGIDLGEDGRTTNDHNDTDKGANGLLNYADVLQAFPLSVEANSFWVWGAAQSGNRLEIYGASDDDLARESLDAGGNTFIKDVQYASNLVQLSLFSSPIHTFTVEPAELTEVPPGLTVLSFTTSGATSEYADTIRIGADADLDGLLDEFENGVTNNSSEPNKADTDSDGFADSIEDKNRNGVWDATDGETATYLADSDGDGVDDWHELHANIERDSDKDTDPLDPDTDNDGLNDGAEDKNHNGIYEIYLGETNPLIQDTDADGHLDGSDNCPSVYNPGQEAWYCTY